MATGPGSIRVRCLRADAKDEEITFEVPWVFGASWSSLRLVSVEIMPKHRIIWHSFYPKNWYSIIVNADD